ncbi:MAG: uracil-DNA glycosylase [Acidiferrobacterales bacterium]
MTRFSTSCTQCPRLARHLQAVRTDYPAYHARPVPAFGDPAARLLIVGLAPGMHGANRTGRPFTGDYAGLLLYRTLHKFGLASSPESVSADDGLLLRSCRITNAVRCLPPANKPTPDEVRTCNPYLRSELQKLPDASVILALGTVAHRAVIQALGLRQSDHPFAHGARHDLPDGPTLLDSYHCSRYNTQTRRLTAAMFESVVRQAADFLDTGSIVSCTAGA